MLLSSRVLPLFFPPAAFQYFVFSFTLCSWQPLSGRSLSAATAALGHGLCSSGFLSGWSLLLASAGPVAAAASPSLCSGCSSLRCPWGLPCCWSPSASSAGARCASFSPPPIIAAARQLMNCPARPAVHGTGRGGRESRSPAGMSSRSARCRRPAAAAGALPLWVGWSADPSGGSGQVRLWPSAWAGPRGPREARAGAGGLAEDGQPAGASRGARPRSVWTVRDAGAAARGVPGWSCRGGGSFPAV